MLPRSIMGATAGLNSRLPQEVWACVMHGCCSLVIAPTGLERTQDMHTATLPRGAAAGATLDTRPGVDLQPPSGPAQAPHPLLAAIRPRRGRPRGDTATTLARQPRGTGGGARSVVRQTGPRFFSRGFLLKERLRRHLHPAWVTIIRCSLRTSRSRFSRRTKVARGTRARRAHG